VINALRLAATGGNWTVAVGKSVSDFSAIKLTNLELAIQAFRERVAMNVIGCAE
jgi:hypothetical protein